MKRAITFLLVCIYFVSGAQDTVNNIRIKPTWVEPERVFEQPKQEEKVEEVPTISMDDVMSIEADKKFIENLPTSYDNVPPADLRKLVQEIEGQIKKLVQEKEELLNRQADSTLIVAKDASIKSLSKEKEIINLSIETDELETETNVLNLEKQTLRKYLITAGVVLLVLALAVFILLQRKTISSQDAEIEAQLKDINKKNTYLEHAAHIIRHDMHSGINTYMPRGLSSLEKRLTPEETKTLKIDSSLKMIKEGLMHTQRVYKRVYEFTNLVKQHVVLNKAQIDLKDLLNNHIANSSYSSQVEIGDLTTVEVNETLFCNAIDNLVKNGLKYNDSQDKKIRIYMDGDHLIVQDNGRGLTQEQFEKICFSYASKKENTDEEASGLGLNICQAILSEHGFELSCEKIDIGTKMKIKLT